MDSFVLAAGEKVEWMREEMVDLHRVDWIIEGICGFRLGGSVSEMGWCNWLLGLLHFICSPTDEVSARRGMISVNSRRERQRKKKVASFGALGWN